MPNRMIRDSARTSPTLDQLSDAAERCFWRLTLVADDFGRFEADARILIAGCFPLRAGSFSPEAMEALIVEMERAGLVVLYFVGGRRYGFFPSWPRHQRVRSDRSRFPAPPSGAGTFEASAAIRGNSPQVAADCGDSRTSAAVVEVGVEGEVESGAGVRGRGAAASGARAAPPASGPRGDPAPDLDTANPDPTAPSSEPDPFVVDRPQSAEEARARIRELAEIADRAKPQGRRRRDSGLTRIGSPAPTLTPGAEEARRRELQQQAQDLAAAPAPSPPDVDDFTPPPPPESAN